MHRSRWSRPDFRRWCSPRSDRFSAGEKSNSNRLDHRHKILYSRCSFVSVDEQKACRRIGCQCHWDVNHSSWSFPSKEFRRFASPTIEWKPFSWTAKRNWTVGYRSSAFSMIVRRNWSLPVRWTICHRVSRLDNGIVADLSSSALSRFEIKQWCSEHQYEFLELEKRATSETENDEEDDDDEQRKGKRTSSIAKCLSFVVYPDVYGIPRLMQTLHVHQWPNMNLKGWSQMITQRFCLLLRSRSDASLFARLRCWQMIRSRLENSDIIVVSEVPGHGRIIRVGIRPTDRPSKRRLSQPSDRCSRSCAHHLDRGGRGTGHSIRIEKTHEFVETPFWQ